MLRNFLIIIFTTLSFSALAGTYSVECPASFADCSKFITDKFDEKFLLKYPAKDWKIVVPKYYVGIMGNGSLKSYFEIAVVPSAGDISTNLMATDYYSKKPKRSFSKYKSGADILALGNPDLNFIKVTMFDKVLFLKAQTILLPIMASEAAMNMIAECDKTQLCNVYEP